MEYGKLLFPVFDNCIEITNDVDDGKILRVNINNHNHAMNRRKRISYSKPTRLRKGELLLVP